MTFSTKQLRTMYFSRIRRNGFRRFGGKTPQGMMLGCEFARIER